MAPFKSSRGRNVGKFVKSFQSSKIGASLGPAEAAATITGGTVITPGNGYAYHVFTHPLQPTDLDSPSQQQFQAGGPAINIDIFVVGGGGGGGSGYYGGGGGGGGVIKAIDYTTSADATYVIEVGNGGRGGQLGPEPETAPNEGLSGGTSKFDDVHILGGGGGGAGPGGNGGPGLDGANAGGASRYTNTGLSTPYTVPASTNPNGTWTYYATPRIAPQRGGPGVSGGDGAGGTRATGDGGSDGITMPEIPAAIITPFVLIAPRMGTPQGMYAAGGSGDGHPNPVAGNNNGGGGSAAPGDNSGNGAGANHVGGGGGGSGNPRSEGGRGGTGCVIIRRVAD